MFEKVEVPVLGIVENMSLHICSECGNEESIFGQGGGTSLADESKVDLLGQLPLDKSIREQTDTGKPSVVFDPSGRIAEIYGEIARKAAGKLAAQAKAEWVIRSNKLISPEEKDSLSQLPITITYTPESHREGLGTYFRAYLKDFMDEWIAKNPKPDGDKHSLYRDGLRIFTTIDSRMQAMGEAAVDEHIRR